MFKKWQRKRAKRLIERAVSDGKMDQDEADIAIKELDVMSLMQLFNIIMELIRALFGEKG